METFDFSTRESHEVYCWLMETRRQFVAQVIEQATELGTDDVTGEVVELNVTEHLAELIKEYVEEVMERAGHADFGAGPLDEMQCGEILAGRLLRCAKSYIGFVQIAEGLLRKSKSSSSETD